MIKDIITIFLLVLLIFLSVGIGYMGQDEIESLIRDIRYEDIEAPEQCRNLTMRETAYCLNDYVKSIFKYNVTDDSKVLTLEELIEHGGDCLNWANLYVEHIEDLGFNAKRPVFDIGEEYAHTFAIISDETGYCILDQTTVKCFELASDSSLRNETKDI